MKLNAKELRELEEKKVMGDIKAIKRHPIYFILENIYDTYNIGGLFRLADAVAAQKIYLCGETETPPNSKIKKASIGTYKVVPWEYKNSAKEAIYDLKDGSEKNVILSEAKNLSRMREPHIRGRSFSRLSRDQDDKITIIAVEQHPSAIPYTKANYQFPVALIFGNETSGILPETLKLADQIVEISMWGINKSLNVIVSAAIVAYEIIRRGIS